MIFDYEKIPRDLYQFRLWNKSISLDHNVFIWAKNSSVKIFYESINKSYSVITTPKDVLTSDTDYEMRLFWWDHNSFAWAKNSLGENDNLSTKSDHLHHIGCVWATRLSKKRSSHYWCCPWNNCLALENISFVQPKNNLREIPDRNILNLDELVHIVLLFIFVILSLGPEYSNNIADGCCERNHLLRT